ncbi:MAG: hypothetical protein E7C83_04965 [Corynebacterium sp.]|uniref:hypothetical protein n=1 Tax=Corynebacterium sp. TaxID=1720 RepID=UPI002901FE5D|nr:hypothetical protein [Corynebacterium sp.]MDU2586489.1 hypothetical protein [Corynebacterium sp.]
MIRTKWSTAGIVAACAVANWLIGMVLMNLDIEEYSPSFAEYGPYICTGFAVGVLGIIALPFALEHQPRELSDVDYAGSTRSFIAGCIVLLGSSSYFGAASGLVAFISMVSRRSTSRSVAAVACFVAAFAIDTIFNPDGRGVIGGPKARQSARKAVASGTTSPDESRRDARQGRTRAARGAREYRAGYARFALASAEPCGHSCGCAELPA